jgi:alkylhydroperoxidase/carboxymuconolactone decarboxylase family protein YurZ
VPETPPLSPVDYLKQVSAETGNAFQALRRAVLAAGPLDAHTCELIALGGLVTAGSEQSFKTHARRLLRDGVPGAALRQAVLVTFAASTTFSQVLEGLKWVEQVEQESVS